MYNYLLVTYKFAYIVVGPVHGQGSCNVLVQHSIQCPIAHVDVRGCGGGSRTGSQCDDAGEVQTGVQTWPVACAEAISPFPDESPWLGNVGGACRICIAIRGEAAQCWTNAFNGDPA